ncbi:MAG TPA: CcdB family protein [Acetobacteraceae bacterium]|jgi:toxin CcdB
MTRLDVDPSPGRSTRGYVPEVQVDLLADLTTRTVVPLLPEADVRVALRDLNPVFAIDGKCCVTLMEAIATVPRRELRSSTGSLLQHHAVVLRRARYSVLGGLGGNARLSGCVGGCKDESW